MVPVDMQATPGAAVLHVRSKLLLPVHDRSQRAISMTAHKEEVQKSLSSQHVSAVLMSSLYCGSGQDVQNL